MVPTVNHTQNPGLHLINATHYSSRNSILTADEEHKVTRTTRSGKVSKIGAEALQQTVSQQEMWMEKKSGSRCFLREWHHLSTCTSTDHRTPEAARESPIFVFPCKPLGHKGPPLLTTQCQVFNLPSNSVLENLREWLTTASILLLNMLVANFCHY